MRLCEVRKLHLVTYENGMLMQEALVRLRQREEIADQLLLLEHPPVITIGRGGDSGHLLASPDLLRSWRIRYFETTRGGDITYHGPGQLVGYPIIHLGEGRRDIRKYVHQLEEVLMATAVELGIPTSRRAKDRGVWVGNDKLAAIGVRVSRWVTSHGFALNVSSNLAHFGMITPCGLQGTGVTSLERLLGRIVNIDQITEIVVRKFAEVFERQLVHPSNVMRVAKVIPRHGDRVLLLHRLASHGDFWQPVTGRLHNEESPQAAAQRELEEETGQTATVELLDLHQSFLVDPAFMGTDEKAPIFADEVAFTATLDSRQPIRIDRREHDGHGWFSFPEAYERIRWSDDREALERVEERFQDHSLLITKTS